MPRKTDAAAAGATAAQLASMRPRPDAAENAEAPPKQVEGLAVLQ